MQKYILSYLSLIIVTVFFMAGCGVKGAPMPRQDEAFIRPSDVRTQQTENKEKDLTELDKKKSIRKKEKR